VIPDKEFEDDEVYVAELFERIRRQMDVDVSDETVATLVLADVLLGLQEAVGDLVEEIRDARGTPPWMQEPGN